MKKKRYQILSPDGFTIERGVNYYPSRKKMMEAFKNWKENYKKQGYYSSVNYGRIHIDDLQDYCQFITQLKVMSKFNQLCVWEVKK